MESCDIPIANPKFLAMDSWVHGATAIISNKMNESVPLQIINKQLDKKQIDESQLQNYMKIWQNQYDAVHDENMHINLSECSIFNEFDVVDKIQNDEIPKPEIVYTEQVSATEVAKKFSLNTAQSAVFNLVIESLFIVSILQRLIYMGGEGGTGKTRVIQAIVYYFSINQKRHELLLAAPTGSAACLINGETIHRLLKISTFAKQKVTKGTASRIRKLQTMWRNVRFLIIDEVSMLSQDMLNKISQALQLAKDNQLPFGGITVLFSGDFAQLPPIKGLALYQQSRIAKGTMQSENSDDFRSSSENGRMAWLNLTHAITLSEQMRQADDPLLHGVLSRLRNNSGNEDEILADYEVLNTKLFAKCTHPEDWADAVIITSRNYLREKLNYLKIRQFAKVRLTSVFVCQSIDRVTKRDCSDAIERRIKNMIKVLEEK